MLEGDQADASRSIQGLLRAAEAVDLLIDRIREELTTGLLPQRGELLDLLALPFSLVSAIERHIYEDVLPFKQWATMRTNFAAVALELSQLEDSLVDLRRAVTWSSKVSGFNWWLRQRQAELGVERYLVIAGPGSCRDYFIERTSGIARGFRQSNVILNYPESVLANLDRLRILTVPQTDGASPKWHPISLGHELAHLRFTKEWVMSWLAESTVEASSAQAAIATAKKALSPDRPATVQHWFSVLRSWLMETACDSTLLYYYGDEGIRTLATYLSVHSDNADGDDHPAPAMRVGALSAVMAADLDGYRVDPTEQLSLVYRRNAYCELAVELRQSIFASFGDQFVRATEREEILSHASESLTRQHTPSSRDWIAETVRQRPAAVESALVGSLWKRTGDDPTQNRPDRRRERQSESKIEHAVDFLQFLHRFDVVRDQTELPEPKPQDRPTNVLYISSAGVGRAAEDAHAQASHDVRLGRHFVVFRRNQIATLNALDQESKSIQEMVEIGWGDTFVLHPGEMVLAVTLESIVMSQDCTAQVLSRSSLGRMGLLSATAVQVQPGFRGCLTLELVNLASVPLVLSPGQRVAQIVPAVAIGSRDKYEGKYQDQDWKPKFSSVIDDWEMPILRTLSKEGRANDSAAPA